MNKLILIGIILIALLGAMALKAVGQVQDRQAARNAQIEKMLKEGN